MIDYDLPIVDSDKIELSDEKFLFADKEGNENILYMQLLKDLGPKQPKMDVEALTKVVIRIQAVARGAIARKITRELKNSGLGGLKDSIKNLGTDKQATGSATKKTEEKKSKQSKE